MNQEIHDIIETEFGDSVFWNEPTNELYLYNHSLKKEDVIEALLGYIESSFASVVRGNKHDIAPTQYLLNGINKILWAKVMYEYRKKKC